MLLVSYGSIYFARDAVEGAVPAHVTGEISTQLKQHVSKTYTVGPTVDRQFWKRERATMDISRGPCMCYCRSPKSVADSLQGPTPKNTLYLSASASSSGLKSMR